VPVKQYRGRILKRLAALVAAKERATDESL